MAFSYLVSAFKQGSSAGSGNTSALDTTGANLLPAVVVDYQSAAQVTPTDSKSNTWTALTSAFNSTFDRTTIWYSNTTANPAVGSGHTFAANGTGTYASISVAAFSGAASSPLDQQNGTAGSVAATVSTGSVTPGQDNELLVFGLGGVQTETISVDVGTLLQQGPYSNGVTFCNAYAYQTQTTATARNPTFSWGGASHFCSAVIGTFKASAGGGSTRLVKMAGEWLGFAGASGGFAG